MEVTINKVSDVQREAEFLLTDLDLQPRFEIAYKKFAPKVEIKGFRKGKVPMPMIKKMYGEALEHEALDDIANDLFRTTMEERNIEPIGRPAMTDLDFKRGEHLRFRVKYEVKPTIELRNYKGVKVKKLLHTVTERDVDVEVERIRRANSTLLGVTLVRDTDDHIITADLQELADDGMPLIGKKRKGVKLSLADETVAQEIRGALGKAEVGETYRVRFETEHDDHADKHYIAISVKKIEKVELPEFDDAFVKQITKERVATKEGFLTDLRKNLETYWAEQSERHLNDALVHEVVNMHDFEVPESLVSLYIDSYLEDRKSRYKDQQLPRDFDEKRFRETNKDYARFQAKWGLLRQQIIEQENLTVTPEELEQLARQEAPMLGIDVEKLLQYYSSANEPKERLLWSKVTKLLRENAEIIETAIEQEQQR